MIIKSQDEKMRAFLDASGIYGINSYNEVIASFTGRCEDFVVMGKYTSEGKALAVLDMIDAAYENSVVTERHFCEAERVYLPFVTKTNSVFQLPMDKDVTAKKIKTVFTGEEK